jgi:DNA-binding winged helix-turn-helix (wHTH) protein/CheY-like chemotaxis protein
MIYQFDCFEINTHNKQLRISGEIINADERLIGLLIELTINYPEYCTKASLINSLWPDTVVSDWSISKLVSDARNLFKKHGYENEVIHTLHGRGYSLSRHLGNQIAVKDQTAAPTIMPLSPANKASSFFKAKHRYWAIAFALLTSIGFFYFQETAQNLQKSEPAHSIGRLLWVDDNPKNNSVEKAYLEKHNITVYQVTSTEEALTSMSLYEYKVVISDMGRNNQVLAGLNLLKTMRQENNETPFLLYTIVLTQAQQTLLDKYQGQGVAVEPDKLYQLVLPYYTNTEQTSPILTH